MSFDLRLISRKVAGISVLLVAIWWFPTYGTVPGTYLVGMITRRVWVMLPLFITRRSASA